MSRVVVIGGGISGLSAAYALQKGAAQADLALELTVFERDPRWGGKIVTAREAGFVVEGGPDTFLATKPWAVDLCRELGLEERLHGTNPVDNNTYILHRDRLEPIPGGLTMMIPTSFAAILRSRLLSWPGKARMGLDFFLPAASQRGEETLGAFISRRLGREAYERLIEPLMSGIYAGDGDRLSVGATLPYLLDLEAEYGGLVKGALALRRKRHTARPGQNGAAPNGSRPAASRGPGGRSVFLTPATGLAELTEALVARLQADGAVLRHGEGVRALEPAPQGYRVTLLGGEALEARGVVLATPAFVSAALLEEMDGRLAGELQAIEYASTATVSLAYRAQDVPRRLDGYGYVIPRREGRQALACTWTSTKFPHRAPPGAVLLRVFIGRAGQEGEIPWDEAGLLDVARSELRQTLGIAARPSGAWVTRWDKAMPQYNLGHLARLERIEAGLCRWSGLEVAGNGYRGVGLPDCINSGAQAANRLLAVLAAEKLAMAGAERPRPASGRA